MQHWEGGEPAMRVAIPGNPPLTCERRRLGSIQLSKNPVETVFAICLLPETFADPPSKWPGAVTGQ